jgi:hyperosmotically inducible periplasmic protein
MTFAVLVVFVGCRAMTGPAGESADDAALTASVKAELVAEKATNLTRVDVDTSGGTVYLNGAVDAAEQKSKAEQIARQAKGVKGVVNHLQVRNR